MLLKMMTMATVALNAKPAFLSYFDVLSLATQDGSCLDAAIFRGSKSWRELTLSSYRRRGLCV